MELCSDFYFSRTFSYPKTQRDNNVVFSATPSPAWEEKSGGFKGQRDLLNAVKGRLGKYSDGMKMRSDWHCHTESLHLFSSLSKTISRHFGSEVTTRAWLKFYDIMARFPSLTAFNNCKKFVSVHLCEAPGAFISALNHRLDSMLGSNPYEWLWRANTLNPYHELSKENCAIFDDLLIGNHPENWLFGTDNTGDILNPDNVVDFWRTCKDLRVDLVTADGAIDCQSNPAEQEATLSLLHFAEIVTASGLLRPGGNFVIKLFTLFEQQTASLVFLLSKLFVEVHAYKPAASKPGNSEVYFICLSYVFNAELVSKLFDCLKQRQSPMFCLDQSFVANHFECAKFFARLQTEAIERNITAFEDLKPRDQFRLYNQVTSARWDAEQYFINKACAPLFRLTENRKLLQNNRLNLMNLKIKRSFQQTDKISIVSDLNHILDENLVSIRGKMPTSWCDIASSLFCSMEKLKYFAKFDATVHSPVECRTFLIAANSPSATVKQLCEILADLSCHANDNICIANLPPPLSRSLAGLSLIILTRFKSISLLKSGAWFCENWQSDDGYDRFDCKLVEHLRNCAREPIEDHFGVVEIIRSSALLSARLFCASIFQANNHFLDLIRENVE